MVTGLDKFKEFFADYRDCYVLIGGSACDVYFTDQELPFRVTHDLDMILCVEALTPSFFSRFWEFGREGGYVHRQKSDGHLQFYRFTEPTAAGYPSMLEFMARYRSEALDPPALGVAFEADDIKARLAACMGIA